MYPRKRPRAAITGDGENRLRASGSSCVWLGQASEEKWLLNKSLWQLVEIVSFAPRWILVARYSISYEWLFILIKEKKAGNIFKSWRLGWYLVVILLTLDFCIEKILN